MKQLPPTFEDLVAALPEVQTGQLSGPTVEIDCAKCGATAPQGWSTQIGDDWFCSHCSCGCDQCKADLAAWQLTAAAQAMGLYDDARVAELADAPDSKPGDQGRGGSTPPVRTEPSPGRCDHGVKYLSGCVWCQAKEGSQ